MGKVRNWFTEKMFWLRTGTLIHIANDGKPIEQITIRYKDLYFFIDLDEESGEPTGDFGWATDPTMNPTVLIRDIWVASPPSQALTEEGEV